MFHAETFEPQVPHEKAVTLALSIASPCITAGAFWCLTCIPHRWNAVLVALRVSFRGKENRQAEAKSRGFVKRSTPVVVIEHEPGCAEQLARFFSGTTEVRVPVQVTALRGGGAKLREATVLEFASTQHAIFISTLPLEFDDHVRVERASRGATTADATVVAVQYHEGRKAVAVRFTQGLCDWVMQP